MRKMFAVGRITGRTAEILLMDSEDAAPTGPRVLQTIVRTSPAVLATRLPGLSTVH